MSQDQLVSQEEATVDHEVTPIDSEVQNTASPDERLVPVSEAIRYRKRAQAAEQQLAEATESLQGAHSDLEQARQAIDQLERRQRIDELLVDSDAVDLEVASLLTEMAVQSMDEPDVKLAVDDLRRHKPYLFRQTPAPGSTMSAHVHDNGRHPAHQAAEQAATSGDRRDLLRYLRLRRKS